MNRPPEEFTDEDYFHPLYCARCKRHVPRALLADFPYCPACLAELEKERRQQEEAQRREAELAEARHKQQEEWQRTLDTGLGTCPQCGSRNLREFRIGGEINYTAATGSCCCGCLLYWPLMLAAPLLGYLFRGPTRLHHACNLCGHTWPV